MDVTENTLLPLEHRPTELGRIRLGHKVQGKGGKEYPGKLEEWRLTSASKALLDAAAALYGGEVKPWDDAPDEGYFELFTTSRELRILIPTSLRTVSQAYELWQGGTCERRCDGTTEQFSGGPCLCDPGNRECEPMTRISIMLPDVPGLGVWRLDTSGYNAATSIPATIELLKQLSTAKWIPAILRLEQRSKKVREDGKVQTHRFAVPVLDLPGLTVGKVVSRMAAGDVAVPELPPKAPPPTAAERAMERAAAITSGPPSHRATVDGPAAGALQPGIEDGASDDSGEEEPPHPALHAGGDTDSPDAGAPGDPEVANPMPAPVAERCLVFHEAHGRCTKDDGHDGPHAGGDGETWAS